MFRPLSLAIGLRYTRAKRRNRLISFHSLLSILGIAIGVTALITTIAVMSGFQTEYRDRILSMVSHASINGAGGPLQDWRRVVEVAHADPRVLGAAPYVEQEALLKGTRQQPALLRGVFPEHEPEVSDVGRKLKVGKLEDLKPGEFRVLLGRELALWLGVDVGDRVQAFVTTGSVTPIGFIPRAKAFTVAGIFEVGAQEYDMGLAVVHAQDLQTLLRMGPGVTGVRLKLVDMFDAWNVAQDLASRLDGRFRVRDWTTDHANMFRALKLEKVMMYIILSLLIAVAAFMLLSSLVMTVTDKQADIAILRTLGLKPSAVMQVFVLQGSLVGGLGIALGVLGGVLLTLNLGNLVRAIETVFGIEVMPADVYYITGLPTRLETGDIALTAFIAFVLCTLATIYPAWRASRTDPVTALRYE